MLSLFRSGEAERRAGDAERERDLSFFSSERERSLKFEKGLGGISLTCSWKQYDNHDVQLLEVPIKTHRERDFPLDFSDALLALRSLFLLEALLPLRAVSRLRERDFSE